MNGLNPYQQRFVQRLSEFDVAFLVVGGQARHEFDGTWDLDIWIESSETINIEKAKRAIFSWLEQHPLHLAAGRVMALNLRQDFSRLMISIPDDDVMYMYEDQMLACSPGEGVELLFRAAHAEFADYLSRAESRDIGSIVVRCISRPDDASMPRLKKSVTQSTLKRKS